VLCCEYLQANVDVDKELEIVESIVLGILYAINEGVWTYM